MRRISDEAAKQELNKLIYKGHPLEAAIRSIANRANMDTTEADSQFQVLKKTLTIYYEREFNNASFINKVHQSLILRIVENDDSYLYDPQTKSKQPIKLNQVKDFLCMDFLRTKFKACRVNFNPRIREVFFEKNGESFFNPYEPPEWLHDHFYYGTPPERHELSTHVQNFFEYFFAGSTESREYTFAWIANSLRDKNFNYLVTIGKQGVGKGILGQMLRYMHGERNFEEETQRYFDKSFNGHLMNKTMIYFDEIRLQNAEHENRLKAFVNNTMSYEGKFKDGITANNYANVYISSNNYDAIPTQTGQRRYSFISLNDESMVGHPIWGVKENIDSIVNNAETLKQIAWYFYNYDSSKVDLMKPYINEKKVQQIKRESMTNWEDYFLSTYCPRNAGKTKLLSEVQEELRMELNNNKVNPARQTLEALSEKFPNFFTTKRINKQIINDVDFGNRKKEDFENSAATIVCFSPLTEMKLEVLSGS